MPLCRIVSTYYCSAPQRTFAPPLRLAGFDMQGKRLYTAAASSEFSKRKRTDVAIRIGPVPMSVNSGALPYKNGTLITRPNSTNCILPRTAMGEHCNGAVTEGENGCRTSGGGDYKPPPTCTEGTSTQDSSVTVLSDEARLVCPEVAVHFSGTLLSSRVGVLSACQTQLEARLKTLQQRLRQQQLLLVHQHTHSQLTERPPGSGDHAHLPARTSQVTPQQPTCGPLPLGTGGERAHLNHRLKQAVKMVDNEMTDVSSEEEEEEEEEEEDGEEEDQEEESSCEEVKERWEQARVTIGSQWVWLEHKLAELNTQICQLDNTLQKRPTKESFTFVVSDVSPGLCYPTNGTLKVVGGAPANHKQQILPNGCSYVGHHPQLPHLLLPDGVLGSKLQVKDLLCASLTRTFPTLMEEEGYSAARTSRPMDRRARRKVIRVPSVPMTRQKCIEISHPHLSRPEDCPSRLWLDAAMSYMATCPLSLSATSYHKRRKNSQRRVGGDNTSYSSGALSVDTPTQTRGRKRHYSSQLSLQFDSSPVPSSVTSPGGHLDTPTCTQPLPSGRKKRVLTAPAFDIDNIVIPYSVAASTRPEKLEYKEIITPSWRIVDTLEPLPPPLEPVENGEEVDVCPRRSSRKRDGAKRPKCVQEEEVTSDEAYLSRHERCEEQEKKRFFNFVTGSNRKRRPLSLTSDGGGVGVGSPAPVAERSKRKGHAVASPTCSEPDYAPSPQIVPWTFRKFPLMGDDLDALDNPPPPPPRLSSSPLFPLTVIPIEPLPPKPHNSNSCSVPDTPLSSPLTPADAIEEVCVSLQEWEVSNLPATSAVVPPAPPKEVVVAPPKEVIVAPPTTPQDSPIILKLTKRS